MAPVRILALKKWKANAFWSTNSLFYPQILVLDEADEMLNKGFKEQIYDVYRYLPPATQVTYDECWYGWSVYIG